ncbi:MAG: hypothetical protein ACNA8O_03510 [Cyanobacteriota bacterium]|jgi:hypothetical protein
MADLDWQPIDEAGRAELAGELAEELHSSNQAWVELVLQRLQISTPVQPDLASEAAAALAAGDWRRGALLYRALLRPDPVAEHRAEGHRPKTPGSW